jgi:hypothetical protein
VFPGFAGQKELDRSKGYVEHLGQHSDRVMSGGIQTPNFFHLRFGQFGHAIGYSEAVGVARVATKFGFVPGLEWGFTLKTPDHWNLAFQ